VDEKGKLRPEDVAILARVSTHKQASKGESLEVQVGRGAKFFGFEIPAANVFKTKQSGKTVAFKRRDLQTTLDAVISGRIKAVYFTDLDRLTRDVQTGWWFVDTIRDAGAKLYIEGMSTEPVDVVTETGRLILGVKFHIAAIEREKASERAKNHIAWRKEQGLRHGGRRNFGFSEEDPNRRHPVEAKYLPRIFEEADAGRGLRTIAKDIRDEGITGTHGGPFSYSNVQWILANPIYAGYVRVWTSDTEYELKEVATDEKTGEPLVDQLVDRDLWHRVNDKRTKQIAKRGGKGRRYDRQASSVLRDRAGTDLRDLRSASHGSDPAR
jgi:site-specific DNA recombinase